MKISEIKKIVEFRHLFHIIHSLHDQSAAWYRGKESLNEGFRTSIILNT